MGLVRCGEGGLTQFQAGEGGLLLEDFLGFIGMLLAPVCLGWQWNPLCRSVCCVLVSPPAGCPCQVPFLNILWFCCMVSSVGSSGMLLGRPQVQRCAVMKYGVSNSGFLVKMATSCAMHSGHDTSLVWCSVEPHGVHLMLRAWHSLVWWGSPHFAHIAFADLHFGSGCPYS